MKAQCKYAFLSGLHARGAMFAFIFLMNLVFLLLGALGWSPFPAQVTAVSLGGVAIAVMFVINIINDVTIISRMFAAPGAYLNALTPAPRGKMLLANVLAMMVMDVVTMAVVITQETLLSFQMAEESVGDLVWGLRSEWLPQALLLTAFLFAGYLMVMMLILFCVAARKSMFYQKRGGTLLTGLLAAGTVYILTLCGFLLAPFGYVTRYKVFFTVTVGWTGAVLNVVLVLIQAAALYVLTAKLMERKINI